MVELDGKVVGSKLIGQDFSRATGKKDADGNPVLAPDPRYFQSRPSVTGYAPAATYFNNQGPNQKDLADQLKGYVDALPQARAAVHARSDRAPDPGRRGDDVGVGRGPSHLGANADIQANRVARERGLSRARVLSSIDEHASRPLFGLARRRGRSTCSSSISRSTGRRPR